MKHEWVQTGAVNRFFVDEEQVGQIIGSTDEGVYSAFYRRFPVGTWRTEAKAKRAVEGAAEARDAKPQPPEPSTEIAYIPSEGEAEL